MRYVVITGVSRGLGEALLNQLLAEPDTTVLALGRTFTDNQRMLAGPKLILRHCELAEPATLPTAPELGELIADADEIVLIHNAAVVGPIGAVGTLPTDELLAAATINLAAPLALTNTLLSALPPLFRRVRIMFVSSGAAHRVIDGWSVYSSTKRGGEEFFAHVAAQYESDPRVSVVSVNPGVMDTGMQEAIRGADFDGRQRFQDLYDNDELPDPASVAAHLIAEHLKA
ncbi:SDR family NAD(P)-dependent oxidoreductase [Catellatospora tritici]|uniref:SDR family NAD(P)-dependent oxidoreductase n=1 Tax=Catellatospora tritici TaxID=2851566 RepID=UPI001C2D39A5|nr:SDR family NAD(P)-dependent oxidoreductase [Catellatospora tritici]MBV1848822.1 SDR family NAD(P)-dependent oxidoreductase [Catellatospora tritici]